MEKIVWKNERRKLKELKPFKGNPRKADEKQIEELDRSLTRFNLADPLVINTDGEVIGGNFRMSTLIKKFGKEKKVDVRVPSRKLTRKEAEELNLRLNKNQGSWDFDILANFSEDLLKDVGFESGELDEIFGLETTDDFDLEKEFEKAVKNPRGVKKGDLWQLGDHRLMIGSATDRKAWERLLGEEKFDFMFTDPPYKLAYSKTRTKKIKTKGGMKQKRSRTYLKTGETDKKGKPTYKGVEQTGGVPEFDEWLSIANDFQNKGGANIMIFENWKNTVELWQAIEISPLYAEVIIRRFEKFSGKEAVKLTN